jgi:peptidoglycan/LPS O-acetylase OafA/YrhL
MKSRLVPIDVLRSVAVFTVMFRHIALGKDNPGLVGLVHSLEETPFDFAHTPQILFGRLFQCGWAGVDLFFVLSGYLVSGLLFREYQERQRLRVGRFLIRRGLKIYPAFYAFLLVGIVGTAIVHKPRPLVAWVCEALFIQNYGANVWGHTWSLAVEEHFYVMLAILLYYLAKKGGPNPFKVLPRIFVFVTVAVTLARIATAIAHPELEHKIHYFPTHLRIDALFFGVMLSYWSHFEPEKLAFIKTNGPKVALISALLVAPTLVFNQLSFTMYMLLPALYVGCGGLLLTALNAKWFTEAPWTHITKPLAFVGVHSYSIYLWHAAILVMGLPILAKIAATAHVTLGLGGEAIFYVVGCIVVGIGMARLIELPVLRLRDKKVPDR